jgi:hypothetical protein
MQIRTFWVDIENAAGAKLGKGPLRPSEFARSALLSASGEFSFQASAADPNIGALSEKRTAICRYIDRSGTTRVFGGGIIDKIVRVLGEDGALAYQVSGNDLTRELTYRSVGALDLSGGSGAGVSDAPDQIMALAPAGWTINDGTTATDVYAGFDGESVLAALVKVGEHIGEHWRLGDGREIDWLGAAESFAASGVRVVQHVNDPVAAETADAIALITGLEEESDAADLLSRVIPRGSGNGGVAVSLAHATDSAPAGYTLSTASNYVRRDATETAYGQIERALDFKQLGPLSNTTQDIQAAANMLLQASVEHLRRYGAPQKFYRLSLAKVEQVLQPGTTLRIVYRKLQDGVALYDLNGTFNILRAENRITAEGIHTTAVTVSSIDRQPKTDEGYLAGEMMGARVLSAHQQLGASTDTLTWRDEMDNSKGAGFRFWLGEEYTSIQRAVFRFRIQPLRSTVKNLAGESTTTASGGASTPTSSGSQHGHPISLISGTPGTPVYYQSGFLYTSGGGAAQTQGETPAHAHSISIPAHTHDLTPVISALYGIFEESSGNTLVEANLVYKLNGGADLGANVVDIGNGWYELDITAALVDSVFRPAQENNVLEITTATDKTARIEAQLTVRGVVQAVAYD